MHYGGAKAICLLFKSSPPKCVSYVKRKIIFTGSSKLTKVYYMWHFLISFFNISIIDFAINNEDIAKLLKK